MSDTAIIALIAVALTSLMSVCGGVWFLARLQQSIMDRMTSAMDAQRAALLDAKEAIRLYADAKAESEARARETAVAAINTHIENLHTEIRTLERAAATRKELRESEDRVRGVMTALQAKMEQVWDAVTKFGFVAEKVDGVTRHLERITTRLDDLSMNQGKPTS